MSKLEFKLNRAGVRQLMQSEKMQAILNEKASNAANRLGAGYESDSFVAGTRAVATVSAETFEARLENAKNNTILKAVR